MIKREDRAPNFFRHKGFTLVELLVVIVILGILMVVGRIAYQGVTQRVQESERKTEINSIAQALNVNSNPIDGTYPNPLQASWFSDNRVPTPPEGGSYNLSYSADNTRYRICASLKDDPGFLNGGCYTTSATCHCKEGSSSSVGSGGGGGELLSGSFRLQTPSTSVNVNQQFNVQVLARTDTVAAVTFASEILYDPALLEILSVDTAGSFIETNGGFWDNQNLDNLAGEAQIIGSVPAPGYQTTGADSLFITLLFRAKASGPAQISFGTVPPNESVILKVGDEENLLNSVTTLNLNVSP